jgi:rRNA maturation protein Nop10
MKPYPSWCCRECGMKARTEMGWDRPLIGCATYHMDTCDVCGVYKEVAEPRDFGYPEFEGHSE